ncbi:hypothetical protein TpMuguga_05g00010 (apicoplast) [Theileria parva strain Muguga]|uniref:Ribosomal protein L5 n=1 Tax=Theileria parva TaxID=5875 RepID=Q4MYB3_THEPA|nr:hypothetical protein TpMuguga_05g00010 [Theileria parva strain Muguga]|eukprot:XP_762679.1 hypothetical protein (apicoplast) [Theileria parva strain Muguga]
MNNRKLITKIILYSYIYDNKNCTDINFIKNLMLFYKTVSRQSPEIILNKKNEIVGFKSTLLNKNLDLFLYKLINFTIPKIKKDLIFDSKNFIFDNNYNAYLLLHNKKYFFEYRTIASLDFNCTFNIQLIFNKYADNLEKLNYIKNILNIKFNKK